MNDKLIHDVVFDKEPLLVISPANTAHSHSTNIVFRFAQKAAASRVSHRTLALYQRAIVNGRELIKK